MAATLSACVAHAALNIDHAAAHACQPAVATERVLSAFEGAQARAETYADLGEAYSRILSRLPSRWADDVFVGRYRLVATQFQQPFDATALIAPFEAARDARPASPAAAYLYARALWLGHRPHAAHDAAAQNIARWPAYPWNYLLRAYIASSYPTLNDGAMASDLATVHRLCPAVGAVIGLAIATKDENLARRAIVSVRAALRGGAVGKSGLVNSWFEVWNGQLSLAKTPQERTRVRKQMRAEIALLHRAVPLPGPGDAEELLAAYRIALDEQGRGAILSNLEQRYPVAPSTAMLVTQEWRFAHGGPESDAPDEERHAYFRQLGAATLDWVERWPRNQAVWYQRLAALDALGEEVATDVLLGAIDRLQALRAANPDFMGNPPVGLRIARIYARRGVRLDRIEVVAADAKQEVRRMRSFATSDVDLSPAVSALWQRGERETLASIQLVRAEGALLQGQLDVARPLLDEARAALANLEPTAETLSSDRRVYFETAFDTQRIEGDLRRVQGMAAGALDAYRTALAMPRDSPKLRKSAAELQSEALRVWRATGHADSDFIAWLATSDARPAIATASSPGNWQRIERPFPDFSLVDLQGHAWTRAALAGKVVFINAWGTWCSPCVAEAPWVQQLSQRLRNRDDILVLTLNVEDSSAGIEPFLERRRLELAVLLQGADLARSAAGEPFLAIPKSWLIDRAGTMRFEQVGFGTDGSQWLDQTQELVEQIAKTQ